MGTGEFIEEMDNESMNYFKSGAEIAEFFRTTFPMSETEGDKLAGYMKGHGYLLGYRMESCTGETCAVNLMRCIGKHMPYMMQ